MVDRDAPVTVAVVDRSATFRRGLRAVLEDAGFRVLEYAGEDVPDLRGASALVLTMDSAGDATRVADLLSGAAGVAVVALAHELDLSTAVTALRSGASAVLHWTSEPDTIVSAVHAACLGLGALPLPVTRDLVARVRTAQASVLDEREAGWLQELASGATVARLAERVGYSEREMFRILAELYQRLGASNRSEALVKATQLGMFDD